MSSSRPRFCGNRINTTTDGPRNQGYDERVVLVDFNNIEVRKISPGKRDVCMKQGLCLRFQQNEYLSKDCSELKRE